VLGAQLKKLDPSRGESLSAMLSTSKTQGQRTGGGRLIKKNKGTVYSWTRGRGRKTCRRGKAETQKGGGEGLVDYREQQGNGARVKGGARGWGYPSKWEGEVGLEGKVKLQEANPRESRLNDGLDESSLFLRGGRFERRNF